MELQPQEVRAVSRIIESADNKPGRALMFCIGKRVYKISRMKRKEEKRINNL